MRSAVAGQGAPPRLLRSKKSTGLKEQACPICIIRSWSSLSDRHSPAIAITHRSAQALNLSAKSINRSTRSPHRHRLLRPVDCWSCLASSVHPLWTQQRTPPSSATRLLHTPTPPTKRCSAASSVQHEQHRQQQQQQHHEPPPPFRLPRRPLPLLWKARACGGRHLNAYGGRRPRLCTRRRCSSG